MNLKEIKRILDSNDPDDYKEYQICQVLAEDKKAIPTILQILDIKHQNDRKLIIELNALLSTADVCLKEPTLNKNNFIFVQKKIADFYIEYKNFIQHCYNK